MTGRSVSQQPGDPSSGNSGPVVPTSHDPLCPHQEFIPGEGVWIEGFSDPPEPVQYYEPCQCDLIARIRAAVRGERA